MGYTTAIQGFRASEHLGLDRYMAPKLRNGTLAVYMGDNLTTLPPTFWIKSLEQGFGLGVYVS